MGKAVHFQNGGLSLGEPTQLGRVRNGQTMEPFFPAHNLDQCFPGTHVPFTGTQVADGSGNRRGQHQRSVHNDGIPVLVSDFVHDPVPCLDMLPFPLPVFPDQLTGLQFQFLQVQL